MLIFKEQEKLIFIQQKRYFLSWKKWINRLFRFQKLIFENILQNLCPFSQCFYFPHRLKMSIWA
jgi:hypothetical protein